jgi:hypothetical protein
MVKKKTLELTIPDRVSDVDQDVHHAREPLQLPSGYVMTADCKYARLDAQKNKCVSTGRSISTSQRVIALQYNYHAYFNVPIMEILRQQKILSSFPNESSYPTF